MTIHHDAEFLQEVDDDQLIDLHRSNLLRLQTSQLLESVAWSPSSKALESCQQLNSFILSLSKRKQIPLLSSTPFDNNVAGQQQITDSSEDLCLPRLTFVGPLIEDSTHASANLTTKSTGNAHVLPTLQVHVLIPDHFWISKDVLKNRYFVKRNRIVWTLAQLLAKDPDSPFQVHSNDDTALLYWRYQYSDVRKPFIRWVQPKYMIDLMVGLESLNWISSLIRLVPNRGNLTGFRPTPHYNQAILEDYYNEARLIGSVVKSTVGVNGSYSNMQQAGILAKIWSLQRGLLRTGDGLCEMHIQVFLEYLLRTKRINPRLSPPQILAAWFKLVCETNWLGGDDLTFTVTSTKTNESAGNLIRKAPSEAYRDVSTSDSSHRQRAVLVVPIEGSSSESLTITNSKLASLYAQQTRESPLTQDDPSTLIALYQRTRSFAAILLDSTLQFNILGRWSTSFVRLLQKESRKSLQILHASLPNTYSNLFLKDARFWSRYDGYLRVRISDIVTVLEQQQQHRTQLDTSDSTSTCLWEKDYADLGAYECIARGLVNVLTRALGDRVHDVRLLTSGNGELRRGDNGSRSESSSKSAHEVDSDQIPRFPIMSSETHKVKPVSCEELPVCYSPIGDEWIVIGLTFNSDTCSRMVDRGPPAEDIVATDSFVQLWGKAKAQLRRFKDGAIIHAVVWDAVPDDDENTGISSFVRFENDDKFQGGIVERIARHVIGLHFLGNPKTVPASLQFALRGISSAVDGVLRNKNKNVHATHAASNQRFNTVTAHRMVVQAFDSLSQFLRKYSTRTEPIPGTAEMGSRLGIPLSIDAVEPNSPALRYSELFPPVPHPLLGLPSTESVYVKEKKIPGGIISNPIEIQIRFGLSSKWPSDLRAIGAAKSAMLVKIIDGMEAMKKTGLNEAHHFGGSPCVTVLYADVGWMGFVFRIRVRADPELKLLRSLNKPNEEASTLLRDLTRRHYASPSLHSMLLSVYTRHPSASTVTRLAKRWIASHLLSEHFSIESIELLVASVYTDSACASDPPASIVTGFLRFLWLLGSHDWAREPLVVDPHGSMSSDDVREISKQFEYLRGQDFKQGPAMYLISPMDRQDTEKESTVGSWYPTFTSFSPEAVVLARAVKLAERSHAFLKNELRCFGIQNWPSVFLESKSSFQSYSMLLRVHPDFVLDPNSSSTNNDLRVRSVKNDSSSFIMLESSYTRSMQERLKGPKALEHTVYRNIVDRDDVTVILHWSPIQSLMQLLTHRFGSHALFFYNELCPSVIGVVIRPSLMEPLPFSVHHSEYARPVVAADWTSDSLIKFNVQDLVRDISQFTTDIVSTVKVLLLQQDSKPDRGSILPSRKRSLSPDSSTSDSKSSWKILDPKVIQ